MQDSDDAWRWPNRQIGRNQVQEQSLVVTARLSKKFYETFGEDVTVDATYRADLRELNETNFARFDAKLEQRLAELKTDLLKWMFAFWVTALLGLGALFFRN